MREISPLLRRAQRAKTILAKHFITRVVLTYGATTYTYDKTKIKQMSHSEQWWSQTANILLDDSDKVLHSRDLEGYKGVISYGLITRSGAEYVATAPLWIAGQQRDSYRDRLECTLSLEGVFDRMAKHKAIATYTPLSTDTYTVKSLLSAIADPTNALGVTMACYTGYPTYTITYDSEDDLIDSFKPADSFRVNLNDTRLTKFKELLGYTDCVARVENDSEIHIFVPTTTGATYDEEYSLAPGYHNFFNKRFRRRIVSPNYIIFKSYPSSGDGFTGYAKDDSADLTDMLEKETHYVRATSSAQCTNLATAYLSKLQMADEKGSATIPFMNFAQEVYDYVKVTDARAGDSRVGNMGYITRLYGEAQASNNFGFGRVPLGIAPLDSYDVESGKVGQEVVRLIRGIAGERGAPGVPGAPGAAGRPGAPGAGVDVTQLNQILRDIRSDLRATQFDVSRLYSYVEQILDILNKPTNFITREQMTDRFLDLFADAHFLKATVYDRLRIPHGTDKFG